MQAVPSSFASPSRGVSHQRDIKQITQGDTELAHWETALDLSYEPGDMLSCNNNTEWRCIVRFRWVPSETMDGPLSPGDVIEGGEFTIAAHSGGGKPLPASGRCLYVCVISKPDDDAGEDVEHCFYADSPDTKCVIQAPTPVVSGWGIIVLLLSLVTALSLVAKRHQKAH